MINIDATHAQLCIKSCIELYGYMEIQTEYCDDRVMHSSMSILEQYELSKLFDVYKPIVNNVGNIVDIKA